MIDKKESVPLESASTQKMTSKWNYPLIEARIYKESISSIVETISTEGEVILGQGVQRLEAEISKWLVSQAPSNATLGLASGTDSVEIALRSCGITVDDYVALPSHTAFATTSAVLRIGARPLFIDIKQNSPTICPNSLQSLFSDYGSKIKAVIAVHLYGEACELVDILDICRHWSVSLIEDCAQAMGTTYMNQPVGVWGDRGCFSFYPTKNLGAFGDGGALYINSDAETIDYTRRMRLYGWSETREAIQWGTNSRLDEIQARLLSIKLISLRANIEKRRSLAELYQNHLSPLVAQEKIVSLPVDGDQWTHSYNLYVIQVRENLRDKLVSYLNRFDVPAAVHYKLPCHQHSFIDGLFPDTELANTNNYVKTIISLPMHPYLDNFDISYVCDHIYSFFSVQ